MMYAFRIWLGRKVSTRRAVIWMSSPVCGFLPFRGRLSRKMKFPNPEILIFSPSFRISFIVSKIVSTISCDSFFERPPTFS